MPLHTYRALLFTSWWVVLAFIVVCLWGCQEFEGAEPGDVWDDQSEILGVEWEEVISCEELAIAKSFGPEEEVACEYLPPLHWTSTELTDW